ncbi:MULTISPECIES: hypothetical protein [unclassified Clostridium]|uniref:hypothetical protein n=1 Tax=unclassified Clostridium TaxID=2614128 RepID=UPI00023B07C0|nr:MULTISPECIES: hypothetical protein [unclassified Clostridium]EHJ01086.1 hypothetical protein CDLVIII_4578 [Clostridium sp. DL-VIII]OOM81266.1 hypothetical protein CLOBL_01780 [Clostridium sp. BL-8]
MKAVKVMSIIGVILLSFCLILLFAGEAGSRRTTAEVAVFFGAIGLIYSIVYGIIVLAASTKKSNRKIADASLNIKDQLIKLGYLREKEIITEQEFNQLKEEYLSKLYR